LEGIVQHVTDTTLERYAVQSLPKRKIGRLEEATVDLFGVPETSPNSNRLRDGHA
jgi:hypothetical protein